MVTQNPVESPKDQPDHGGLSVGIDMEHCDRLPAISDASEQAFYSENFTRAEIAYCRRRANPRESFCGLWCAKEAAMKCGVEFLKLRPLELEIGHDAQGQPFLMVVRNGNSERVKDCTLSISHSQGMSVAVCMMGA